MIKPSASLHLLASFWLSLFALESKPESIPSNIENGFLPPFTATSAQTLFLSVDPGTTASFHLQRLPLGFTTSLDIPITLNDAFHFEVDVPIGAGAFRLKSNGTPPRVNIQSAAFRLLRIYPSAFQFYRGGILSFKFRTSEPKSGGISHRSTRLTASLAVRHPPCPAHCAL